MSGVDDIVEEDAYYPDHEAYGKWEEIFEHEIDPKITGCFDIMKLQQLNKCWKEKVGVRINSNKVVDWSNLEKILCQNSEMSCPNMHKTLVQVYKCRVCSWSTNWKTYAFNKGVEYYTKTHGGLKDKSNANKGNIWTPLVEYVLKKQK